MLPRVEARKSNLRITIVPKRHRSTPSSDSSGIPSPVSPPVPMTTEAVKVSEIPSMLQQVVAAHLENRTDDLMAIVHNIHIQSISEQCIAWRVGHSTPMPFFTPVAIATEVHVAGTTHDTRAALQPACQLCLVLCLNAHDLLNPRPMRRRLAFVQAGRP